MGTSSAFGGQGGDTPLVPSWLGDDGATPAVAPAAPDGPPDDGTPPPVPPSPGELDPPPAVADPRRFKAARNNFSRFASSGGAESKSLGRAVSRYVRSSVGGARTAARRMGSSRGASRRLVGFVLDARARGAAAALRTLNLVALADRPIEEIFLGVADYVCPDGGSIDEGIARAAFIETIADLADAGIADLDSLTVDQVQTVFELYATHAIEARICNDIGSGAITLPRDIVDVDRVQAQLHDFLRRGVADALTAASGPTAALSLGGVHEFVGAIYEQAFAILELMGGMT